MKGNGNKIDNDDGDDGDDGDDDKTLHFRFAAHNLVSPNQPFLPIKKSKLNLSWMFVGV